MVVHIDKPKKYTLKEIRLNNNWTIEKAAELYGIDVSTLFLYETGKSFPNISVINRILKVTGMKYDDIIFLPVDYGKTVNK